MRNTSEESFFKRKKVGKVDLDDFIWYVLLGISIIGLSILLLTGVKLLLISDSIVTLIYVILISTSYFCISDKYETEVKTLAIICFIVMIFYHYGNKNFIEDLRYKVNKNGFSYTYNANLANVNNVDNSKLLTSSSVQNSWVTAATKEGLKPIKDLDNNELAWCKKDDDNNGILNANEYYQAALHCTTGTSWTRKEGWSDKKL